MVSILAKCWPLYRLRYLPIVGRYVDLDSADISVDSSVDTSTDKSRSLYRLRVGQYFERHICGVFVDMSNDISVEGCKKYSWSIQSVLIQNAWRKSCDTCYRKSAVIPRYQPKGNPFVTKHAAWDCSWGHWERDVGVFSMYCCYGNLWYKKDDHNLLGSEWDRCVISLSLVLSDKEFTDPSKCKCWIKQATVISHPRTGPLK